MSIHKSYAVFGLGRYGFSVAKQLVQSGADVLAVDCNQSIVNSAIGEIPICKCADVTDMEVLKQLGVAEIDVVIIALAKNLEASVMAVMLCKELKVGTVIVKCANEMHKKILEKVSASFMLTEQEAMEIIQSESQVEYSTKVYDAIENLE